jgi:hypothetical protein
MNENILIEKLLESKYELFYIAYNNYCKLKGVDIDPYLMTLVEGCILDINLVETILERTDLKNT